jgi:serine/threonine protein kinase
MAQLFLARHVDGRAVVIKRVAPELEDEPRYTDLLVSEAHLTAQLVHPNIVRVIGFGRCDDGIPYLGLERVEGLDLRQLLRVCTQRKIALPIAHTLTILAAVLRALEHVHRARDECGERLAVVHRDVSPSNVLLGFDGSVKLCDFGISIAKCMPEIAKDIIEGKAGYMSPEHASFQEVDQRADLYAAGIMLWELLSGRRMYKAKSGESLLQVARRADTAMLVVRGLPREEQLHAVVRRALCREREDRYQSAGEMLRDLDAYRVASGLQSSEKALSRWLAMSLPDWLLEARAGTQRAHAAPDLADPVDIPVRSGARLIKRPEPTAAHTPSHDAEFGNRQLVATTFLACGVTLAMLTVLASLGVL